MNPMIEAIDKVARDLYGPEILNAFAAMRKDLDRFLKEHPDGFGGDEAVSYLLRCQEERDS